MNAIAYKDGKKLFQEKCLCGNPELTINKENKEYATCLQCLRVYRVMFCGKDEKVIRWGIYFDPYLRGTLVGEFINFIEPLPLDRYPLPFDK